MISAEESAGAVPYRCSFSGISLDSFEFQAVYYTSETDYDAYMKTQEDIYLYIVREFRREGIYLAGPVSRNVQSAS